MGFPRDEASMVLPSISQNSAWFEIRLFYVRVSPCVADCLPNFITLLLPRREIGVALEINGSRVPTSESARLSLRRDRVDKEASEVTYVSTDSVRVTGSVEFAVYEGGGDVMILCGALERLETLWTGDSKTGWSLDCYPAAVVAESERCSAFFQPKMGVSSPSFEVYIAGCCLGSPVILTKMVQISPRRRVGRQSLLDAIPEEEDDKEGSAGFQKLKFQGESEVEVDEYSAAGKHEYMRYANGIYTGEDGQLSWFNAGVRVGVGIGLGVCIGAGLGVGLLMRSYQATTRKFMRKLL
uniref:Erythronate-4-phosphate dehydrogenase family protein n=1 Tax=Kalanchoe fedtschenkoi TaxID=63787 RepID=A0A7N0ULY6_KALFE